MSFLLTFLLLISFQSPDRTQQLTIEESGNRYLIYDTSTDQILEVEKSESSADSLIQVSNQYLNTDTQASLLAARQARIISEDLNYLDGIARAYNLLGINYSNLGDYEQALEFYVIAMEIEEELGNDDRVALLLNNFATVYAQQGNLELTRQYYQESIDRLRKIGQVDQIYTSVNNMGVVHRRQGDYDRALEYFFEAAEGSLNAEPPDSNLYMIATLNIGNTYRNKEEFESAVPFFRKAEEYFDSNSQSLNLVYTYTFSAELYNDLGNYSQALEYINKAIAIAEVEQYLERLLSAYLVASSIYEQINDFQNAHTNFKAYHAVSDSLRNSEITERLNELQIRYEVDQKDQEIALLNSEAALAEAQLQRQELYRNVLVIGFMISLIFILLLIYINRIRKKKNNDLRNSRLEIEIQNKTLAKLNREKDEFLSLAAHDLRSPLSSVMMITDIIKHSDNISEKELEEYTDIIHVSSEKMLTLINNLLEVQSEKIKNENKHLDLIEVLENVVENFKNAAERKQIKIELSSKTESLSIYGISNYLMRIFDNLISNAIKYSPQNSTISINVEKGNDTVLIAVKDQGPGIPEDEKHLLFTQFGTTSNKPTGNEQSTGLGLYIVKKFTKSMNGDVWYEGESGKGSTFYVELKLPKDADSKPENLGIITEKAGNL